MLAGVSLGTSLVSVLSFAAVAIVRVVYIFTSKVKKQVCLFDFRVLQGCCCCCIDMFFLLLLVNLVVVVVAFIVVVVAYCSYQFCCYYFL